MFVWRCNTKKHKGYRCSTLDGYVNVHKFISYSSIPIMVFFWFFYVYLSVWFACLYVASLVFLFDRRIKELNAARIYITRREHFDSVSV